MDVNKVGIIILAAGASTRLGKPKQLLTFQNKTLISKAVESAINSKCSDAIVVLGSNAEKIKQEIVNFPVKICVNKTWQSGMASSIKCGLEKLLSDKAELNAVIIMLCDQPFIKSEHINLLIENFEKTNKDIIAAKYENTIGVPALFSDKIFDELLQLKGDKGARQVINKFADLLAEVPLSEAKFDIDTVEDFEKCVEVLNLTNKERAKKNL